MEQTGGSRYRVSTFGVAALAMVGAAILAFLVVHVWDERRDPGIVIVDPQAMGTIVVAVEGAVATPGVYDLPGSARVRDAIEAAGGPSDDANLRPVNLARRLRDEERVVVPGIGGEARMAATGAPPASPTPSGRALDVNRATTVELEALPGIGPVLAGRIVDYRDENGPFQTVEELADVQGISERMVDELRPFVTVGP